MIHCDSQIWTKISKKTSVSWYIETHLDEVSLHQRNGRVKLQYISTDEKIAYDITDVLTNPFSMTKYRNLWENIGVANKVSFADGCVRDTTSWVILQSNIVQPGLGLMCYGKVPKWDSGNLENILELDSRMTKPFV